MRWLLKCALLCHVISTAAAFNEAVEKTARARKVETGPVIDGKLDDTVWQNTQPITDFVQIQPVENSEPSEQTEVRIVYDQNNLYIAARLLDKTPNAIVAKQMIQGQTFFSDDRFSIMLDTFKDRRNGYFFQMNANSIRRDALVENNANWQEDWDAIWHGKAKIGPDGWTVEMAIPFKSLSFDPNLDSWGVQLARIIPRRGESLYWALNQRVDFIDAPAYGGTLTGLGGMNQGLGLDVVPTATGGFIDTPEGNNTDGEPSINVFYKPTPSLTAALTANTDFSATEVDDRQVNLDRFSLFFPEKRDFFLQDAGIFQFGDLNRNGRPFFSRRIGLDGNNQAVPIRFGLKATGRTNHLNYGVLGVSQDAGADDENLWVGRIKGNVLKESTVGAIFTSGDPTGANSNRVYGVDGKYRNGNLFNGQAFEAAGWYLRSDDGSGMDETANYGARVSLPNDRIQSWLSFNEIQENHQPALGFVNRTGIRFYEGDFRYRIRRDSGLIREIRFNSWNDLVTDTNNELQSREAIGMVEIKNHVGDWVNLIFIKTKESLDAPFEISENVIIPKNDYTWEAWVVNIGSGRHRAFRFWANGLFGDYWSGTRSRGIGSIEWRQSRHFFLSAEYQQNNIDLAEGKFITRLWRVRANVAFSAAWSWSNFIQYDNVSDVFGMNSRLRWIPRAGREVFFVLNHNTAVEDGRFGETLQTGLNLKGNFTFRF